MGQDTFQEFVHYVCSTCENPALLSETKLHKALWFVDTYAYRKFGRALSDATYIKEATGPIAQQLPTALSALEEAGFLLIRSPDAIKAGAPWCELQQVSAGKRWGEEERQLIQTVVNNVCQRTDASISALSHDEIWKTVSLGEEMPVAAVLAARAGEITEEDVRWAQEEINALSQQDRERLKDEFGAAS